MRWENDWPVIGVDQDNNGVGEPVQAFRKPAAGKQAAIMVPQTGDEFSGPQLGLQWQWEGNFSSDWNSLIARPGWLRSFARPRKDANLWSVPSLMLQKFPAPAFEATVHLDCTSLPENAAAGLLIFGLDYSHIAVSRTGDGYRVSHQLCLQADKGTLEESVGGEALIGPEIYLRVMVKPENERETVPKVMCDFSYSEDGRSFRPLGKRFLAREGQWVGAKVGLFALGQGNSGRPGFVDIDWFRIAPLR